MLMERKIFHVLVIEDNPGDYALVEEFLSNQTDQFSILRAENFEKAKIILCSAQYSFDVVVLDISLPDNSGMPLINDVVSISNNTPIIVLTGNSDIEFSVRSLGNGVSDYILKHDLNATTLYKSIIYSIERKKSSLELTESERKYGELFHLSPLPMWVTNLDTMQFVDVNEATLIHYGYSREEFLNMTTTDLNVAGDCAATNGNVTEGNKSAKNTQQRLVTHIKKNGELINVELQIAQVIYKGAKSGIVIAKDVTERMNYIKAMEAQNEKLKQISWIQSHVVRSPLTRIIGLIPLIENAIESAGDEETKRMLKYLAFSANELDSIIMDITKISENEEVEKQKNNVFLKRVS